MIGRGSVLTVFLAILTCILPGQIAQAQARQAAPAAPSVFQGVAGIRPGMPAQEAYSLLKARNPNIRIGIGQMPIPGFSEKPIVTEMSAQVVDASAPETLTVWLTLPPGKQVVWAVGQVFDYDPSQPLLRSKVLESLREKYGPETDANGVLAYWLFDQQGKRPDATRMRQSNCGTSGPAQLTVHAPQGVTFPAVSTLIYPVQPDSVCNAYVRVWAEMVGTNGIDTTYIHHITLMVWDLHLHRQAHEAYHAYLANRANAQNAAEMEKAKQRKTPKF